MTTNRHNTNVNRFGQTLRQQLTHNIKQLVSSGLRAFGSRNSVCPGGLNQGGIDPAYLTDKADAYINLLSSKYWGIEERFDQKL
jgi:hypothetical protein